jgi:flagellar hook-basal body complex protein FliE
MTLPVTPIRPIVAPELARVGGAASGAADFRSVLQSAVDGVENFQAQAGQSVERFLSGESEELHATALAVQRAELSFELFIQTRNKVVQAYQEIMRMQM